MQQSETMVTNLVDSDISPVDLQLLKNQLHTRLVLHDIESGLYDYFLYVHRSGGEYREFDHNVNLSSYERNTPRFKATDPDRALLYKITDEIMPMIFPWLESREPASSHIIIYYRDPVVGTSFYLGD